MAFQTLLMEQEGPICRITLNRPDKLNALSHQLLEELHQALDAVEADHSIRVLILTGKGRAFSTGFDISPGGEGEPAEATARWDGTHWGPRVIMKLWYLRQPTISAVNGYAMAAGNVLAMACDLVIAAETAQFAEPEIRHGAHSPFVILPFLGVPSKHLHYFYYTGDTIDARTAERWNMVTKVVPPERLQEEAWALAQRIAMVPPFSVQMMKRSLRLAYDRMGLTEALEGHLMLRMVEHLTPNVPETEALRRIREEKGMRAFLEARDGPFQSR